MRDCCRTNHNQRSMLPLRGKEKGGARRAPPVRRGGTSLLHSLAVESEVEAVALDLDIDPEPDHEVDDLEQDQADDHVVAHDDGDTEELVENLPGIALDQARGPAIFGDGEDAGQDGAGGAADGMDAEAV